MSDKGTALLKQIEVAIKPYGVRALGVADLDALAQTRPEALALAPSGFGRALVAGVRLNDTVLEMIDDRPIPLYLHHYRQANYQLDRLAFVLADLLQREGYRSLAVPASQVVSRDPMRGMVSHRMLGQAAGLGHIGRSRLLVHPKFGARWRVVSVLTEAPLPPNRPSEGDCGDCRACLKACPAQAIGESSETFDLAACTRKLTEFTRIPYVGQHICGVCVKACAGRNRNTCPPSALSLNHSR